MHFGALTGFGPAMSMMPLTGHTRIILKDKNYTFERDDAGSAIGIWRPTAVYTYASYTYTIPKDIFPLFTVINAFYMCEDTLVYPTITIAGASGVTIRKPGTNITGSRTLYRVSFATLIQMDVNDWWVDGPGVT